MHRGALLPWLAALVFGLAVASCPSTVSAQAQAQPIPPVYYNVDERGVDLVTGELHTVTSEVVIGQPGSGGMSYGRVALNATGTTPGGWRDTSIGGMKINPPSYDFLVTFNGVTEVFTSGLNPRSETGSTLVFDTAIQKYVYTTSDGTEVRFLSVPGSPYNADYLIETITAPNGEKTTYTYAAYCSTPPCSFLDPVRLQARTNNFGYQIHYRYDAVSLTAVENVVGLNMAEDYCDPAATTCGTFTRLWPSITYTRASDGAGGVNETATDQISRQTLYHLDPRGQLDRITLPGETTNEIEILRNGDMRVEYAKDATGEWTYTYSTSGATRTTNAVGPLSQKRTVVSNLTIGRPLSIETVTSGSPLVTSTTAFQYDGQQRLERVTYPEGDYTVYGYDGRGNVASTTMYPKPGVTIPPIVYGASYPALCTDPGVTIANCNKPRTTTDPLMNVTTYAWENHGGIQSVTSPLTPDGQPQTRYLYSSFYARFKDSSGAIVPAASSVTLPVMMSQCSTGVGSGCLGTASEVRTGITYGSPLAANNLLPTVVTRGAGDGSLTATDTVSYTPQGDIALYNGPLAGTADTTRFYLDGARRYVGVVGPDPDGTSSPLLLRSTRVTLTPSGSPILTEVGTMPAYGSPFGSGFVTLQRQAATFDGYRRPTYVRQQDAAGNTLQLEQVSYDLAGRPDCVATRMNPNVFSTPPAVCTPGLGSFGWDRITQTTYDAAGRPIATTEGLGVPGVAARVERVTYTANGNPATLQDASTNVTTMTYDRFDRPWKTTYPNPLFTDYDETTYDAASNVVSFRDRGGQTTSFTYDPINRLKATILPSDPDEAYAYDNLSRMTVSSNTLQTTTWVYDSLSRRIAEYAALGTVLSEYDLAGRRTKLTWPSTGGAFYATYTYDLYDGQLDVRQNGSSSAKLVVNAFDNLGRRVSSTRSNGVVTTYSYDGISRLASLAHNLAGTANDVTFTYAYNPAGQIISRDISNSAYAWNSSGTLPFASTINYTNNSLNQVIAAEYGSIGYSGDANLTTGYGTTKGYDDQNRLSSSGAAVYAYDGAGRLLQEAGSLTTRFLYDGWQAIAEYDPAGNLSSRYIPGAGLDEFVTQTQGTGTSVRYWPLTDERGSIISLSTSGGAPFATNTYDEYGLQSANNQGRLSYTGLMQLADSGMLYARNRFYQPGLGRFVQTDPIGYGAGANLYAYVTADPINFVDPMGLDLWDFLQRDRSGSNSCTSYEIGRGEDSDVGDVRTNCSGNGNYGRGRASEPLQRFGRGCDDILFRGFSIGCGRNLLPASGSINIIPSRAYQSCFGQAVGGDGTILGNLVAAASVAALGAPIVDKGRFGTGTGGPSGRQTTYLSGLFRSAPNARRPAGPGLRAAANAVSSGNSRTARFGAAMGRISSRAAGVVGLAGALEPVERIVDASARCEASVGR